MVKNVKDLKVILKQRIKNLEENAEGDMSYISIGIYKSVLELAEEIPIDK